MLFLRALVWIAIAVGYVLILPFLVIWWIYYACMRFYFALDALIYRLRDKLTEAKDEPRYRDL